MEQFINHLKETFLSEFNEEPQLFFSPGRINFIGEHTDYNNGYVFPAAIDKGIYLAIAPSSADRSTVKAIDLGDYLVFDVHRLEEAGKNSWMSYVLGVIAELQKKGLKPGSFNAVFTGTIDVGSGMSSSAALENAFVFALNTIFNLELTKEEMIRISQAAEHNYVGVKCGIMDQFASMFGKKDAALFLDCKTLESATHPMCLEGVSLLIINTNVKHKLSDSAYNKRRETCERVADYFGVDTLRELQLKDLEEARDRLDSDDYIKASYVLEENNRVLAFKEAVGVNDIKLMGHLLYASHEGLRNKYQVSCEELDFLVDFGKNNPQVLGSRMMGGGFGGCTINLVMSDHAHDFGEQVAIAYETRFSRNCNLIKVKLSDGTRKLQ